MAPSRKSKSVNKRFSYIDEVASNKDAQNANKSGNRKRKLSDMLGSQWSNEELGHFYEAYRMYGKDWKKVAAVIRNRSVEMVEALYTMNRAYLSLPEGTASMVGLIAMMTDHYSVLGGSDSERENNYGAGASRKHQKLGKERSNISKGSDRQLPIVSQSQKPASNYGCLSLLKKRRSGTKLRAVGKRTPRVPISLSYDKDNGEKHILPTRRGLKADANDVDDDDVAHEIAIALTEASQRGDSPQISRTPKRKTEASTVLPARNGKREHGESDLSSDKLRDGEMDEDYCELSLGSTEADNGYYARDGSHLTGAGGAGMGEVQQKGKRYHGKKPEAEENIDNQFDDIKEACSGTEEGQTLVAVKGKVDSEIADSKPVRSSKGPRNKIRNVMFGGDECFDFNPLEALADLSLMMPATNFDTESSLKSKDENIDVAGKSKQRGHHSIPGVDVTIDKTPKLGRALTLDGSSIVEEKEGAHQSNAGIRRRKQKSVPCKMQFPKNDILADSQPSEVQKIKVTDEVKNFVTKGKRSHSAARLKQGKLGKTSVRTDHEREGKDVSLSKEQIPSANHYNLMARGRSRRKMDIQITQIQTDLKYPETIVNDQINTSVPSFADREGNLKKKLANLLSWYQARRWCASEWFYSAIDYPWFAKREFMEYLDHVGLGHVPRLTRIEWGVIRSSLGRPRRFSEQFLKEEKEKLNHYRESVRKHYTELRAGTREGLPTDLAQPLTVGQHVIAIHPRTREIHDGSVLTVDHSRCRVQFDRPELGVEFVMDYDCMPSNPVENMPASLARNFVPINKGPKNFNELKSNGLPKDGTKGGGMKFSSGENLENSNGRSRSSPSAYNISNSMQSKGRSSSTSSQVKVGCSEPANSPQAQVSIPTQIQSKEADVQALSALTRALEKKEAVVSELRRMNDLVLENQKDGGDDTLKDSDTFKKKYAEILFQLHEINDQVSSALCSLRQRNTYQGNSTGMWLKPTDSAGDSGGQSSSFDYSASHSQESGTHVAEIVESSRTKARTLVTSAMQAMSSLKERGNDIGAIEDAIDFVNNRISVDDLATTSVKSSTLSDTAHVTLASQDQLPACTSNPLASSQGPVPKSENLSEQNEPQIPSELIAHCVATLLMIQMCTERQFPPADVAQVLDSAVTSLQPCCSQNLLVYAEIQKCMGIIKNQILALVPT